MTTVKITSAIKLSEAEIKAVKDQLGLSQNDTPINEVDPSLIAGLKVNVNGLTIDLSIKRQLDEIAQS